MEAGKKKPEHMQAYRLAYISKPWGGAQASLKRGGTRSKSAPACAENRVPGVKPLSPPPLLGAISA